MEINLMRSTFFSRYRRWLGASALAILVGLGGGSAFLAASSPTAFAQVQNAAAIDVPAVSNLTDFADLVEKVQPAVVSITVESDAPRNGMLRGGGGNGPQFQFEFPDLPDDHPMRDFFEQFGRQFGEQFGQGPRGEGAPAPRAPRHQMAAGSGFVISADGYIVTNNHVVQNATKVLVTFDDGVEREAKVIGTDPGTDLAVVKIEGENLPYVPLSAAEARVGEWVVAVGNPFGLGGTVTAGIVSARGRDIAGSDYGDFLQIDAAVNTGNSGGPAFNLGGEVIGVNTAIYSPTGGSVGIAFAIPAAIVKQVTDDLIANGIVTRGFLGVGIQNVSRDIADSVGLDAPLGALVTEPAEGGPAKAAGVLSGDVIVKVDGDEIRDSLDLKRTIAAKDPGTEVTLDIWRDGADRQVKVKLGTLEEESREASLQAPVEPEQPATPVPSATGLTLVPNAGGPGVLIQDVDQASMAAEQGFQVGDTILEVNNQAVASADEFEKAIAGVKERGRNTALIKAQRDGQTRFIGLPLSDNG
jgi:serine protease Do